MSYSPGFRDFVIEQLSRVAPVTGRGMFGGVGIYCDSLFFALISEDVLYFKVDDGTRARYEAAGMRSFRPYGEGTRGMDYFEVPAELLENPVELRPWMFDAIGAARNKVSRKRK
jgi:DNA transformation protein and related proteins